MREEIIDGARWEPGPGNGLGKELVAGERWAPGESEGSIGMCDFSGEEFA